MSVKKETLLAGFMAAGLVLFIWHVRFPVFPPWIGLGLLTVVAAVVLTGKGKLDIGPKALWIPLAIVCISIAMSGVESAFEGRTTIQGAMSAAAVGVLLFGLFISSRQLGDKPFKLMPYAVIVEAASIIVYGAINGWKPNGGLLSPTNYDIATGLLVFGVLTSPKKHQWWLSAVALAGAAFSGSGEAIFAAGVFLVALVSRKDWGWKLSLPIAAMCIIGALALWTPVLAKAQAPQMTRLDVASGRPAEQPQWVVSENGTLGSRWDQILGFRLTHSKLSPIKPFGYGINLTQFYWGIPHNVILIIIEQVGVAAALAWLWVVGYSLKSFPMKYAVGSLLILGVLDHFVWTQAAVWWPVIIGWASVSRETNDYIFRRS